MDARIGISCKNGLSAVSNALVTGMSSTAPIDSLLRMLSAQSVQTVWGSAEG